MNIFQMRERLINGRFVMMKDRVENGIPLSGAASLGGEGEDEKERVVISKCYSSITVSTNSRLVSRYSVLGN